MPSFSPIIAVAGSEVLRRPGLGRRGEGENYYVPRTGPSEYLRPGHHYSMLMGSVSYAAKDDQETGRVFIPTIA